MINRHSTTASHLVDRIAQDIQQGFYGPGTWLKQIDLQTRYNATRLEVRKALDLLALKRLIEHIPNRGYHVFVPNSDHIKKLRDVRTLLECGAAQQIIATIEPSQIQHIRALADEFAALVETGTLLQQYEANLRFHAAIYQLCPNDELVRLIVENRSGTPSAPATQWRTHARIQRSAEEHYLMVEALETKNLQALQDIIIKHISQSED